MKQEHVRTPDIDTQNGVHKSRFEKKSESIANQTQLDVMISLPVDLENGRRKRA